MHFKKLEDILVSQFNVTEKQLTFAREMQGKLHKSIGDVLVEQEVLSEEDALKALAISLGFEYYDDLNYTAIDPALIKHLTISFCLQYMLIPVNEDALNIIV